MSVLATNPTSRSAPAPSRRVRALALGLSPLVLLLGVVLVAGLTQATIAVTETHHTAALSSAARTLEFHIANEAGLTDDRVVGVEFGVPQGWRIETTGHSGPSGWTFTQSATNVNFTTADTGGIGDGQSATFFVRATARSIATNASESWNVNSTADSTCLATCFEAGTVGVWTETLGVASLVIAEPAGAADGEVSAGQTVRFDAVVVNTRTTAVTTTFRVSATGETATTSPQFTAAASGSTNQSVWFTFSNPSTFTKRAFQTTMLPTGGQSTVQLNDTNVFVVRPPVLNGTKSNVFLAGLNLCPIAGPCPSVVTHLLSQATEPSDITPVLNRTTGLNVTINNTGQAGATDISVAFQFYNEAGENMTSRFTVTGPAPAFPTNVSGNFNMSNVTFNVTPNTCASTSGCPTDGKYNMSFLISFRDENIKNGSTPLTVNNVTSAVKIFSVDSVGPSFPGDFTQTGGLEFRRGGHDRKTYTINLSATELNFDGSSLQLVIFDDTRQKDCTTAATGTPSDPPFRCVVSRTLMTKSGNDWTASFDYATQEALVTATGGRAFRAYVVGFDRAGLEGHRFIDFVNLDDTLPPVATSLSGPTSLAINQPYIFSADVRDDHEISGPTGQTGVWLRAFHRTLGKDLAVTSTDPALTPVLIAGNTADGVPMICTGCTTSKNGTYSKEFFFKTSGIYELKVFARDRRTNEAFSVANITVDVTSGFSFFVEDTPGNRLLGKNLTVGAGTSQLSQGVVTNVKLKNEAGAAESYNWDCRILTASSNVSGLQGCNVSFLNPNEVAPVGSAPPAQERSWANVVNVTIYDNSTGTPAFLNNITGLQNVGAGVTKVLDVHLSAPPAARPGNVVRVELTAKPKFATNRAAITLGYDVAEARGVSLHFADTNAKPVAPDPLAPADQPSDITRIIKPTRMTSYALRLNNTGNVETRFDIDLTSTLPAGWTLDLTSTDTRWNDLLETILLAPAATPGGLNSTTVLATLTAPANEPEVPGSASDRLFTFRGNTSTTTGTAIDSPLASLRLKVKTPSISIGNWDPGGANFASLGGNGTFVNDGNSSASPPRPGQNCNGDADHPRAGNASFPKTKCSYVSGGWTAFNFTVSVNSTLNVNPSDARIRATALVTTPCGTSCPDGVLRVPLVPSGGQFQGQNGAYFGAVNFTDPVGNFNIRIQATDAIDLEGLSGDTFESLNVTVSIPEPQVRAPTQCCVQILEGSATAAAIVPDQFGHYRANFGVPIFARATLDDSFGLAGNLSTMDLQVTRGGVVVETIPMLRTASTLLGGSPGRVVNATYQGVFTPRGSFQDAGGAYLFQFIGKDGEGATATSGNLGDIFAQVDLLDQLGPSIVPLLRAAGLSGAALDVEVGVGPVNITARITDNSDAVPGGSINNTSDRHPFARMTLGSVVKNYTLQRVAGSLDQWTVTVPQADVNATGNYSIEISAWDTANNLARNTTTLQVLVNLAPAVSVQSPPAVDGQRFVSLTAPVVVQIVDANLDANATNAIVVEVSTGGNFSRVTPTITGSRPTFTVTVPVGSEGNATVRVSATDTLGLTSNLTFSVRVDTSVPVGSVSVVATEIGSKAFRASAADPFFVAPSTRLQVAASDAGSGIASVVVVARPAQAGQARNHSLGSPTSAFTLVDIFGANPLDGDYLLSARVTDRVGNVGTAPEVTVKLDTGPPVVVTPRPASPLTITASDTRSGVRGVEVEWSATETGARSPFSLTKGSGDTWTGDFPAEASGSVFFLVKATDNVGNEVQQRCGTSLCSLALGNRAPIVNLTVTSGGQAVAAGGQVRGAVSIGWSAVDPDGSQVSITLKVRNGTGADKNLLTSDTLTVPPFTWDTAAEADGTYTIVLEGSDGTQTGTATLQVVVRNIAVAAESALPSNVNAGGSLLFAYEVSHPTKTVKSVVAVLRVGGQRENVPLFDDGTHGDRAANDDTWSATYTPRLRGQHTVDLLVTFEDNSQSTIANVGSFGAQGVVAQALSGTFLGALFVGVVVAALGIFGLRRWG